MESSLFDAIKKDLDINTTTVQRSKINVEVLDISPVSELYARKLAAINYALDKSKNTPPLLDEKTYFECYYDNNVSSITAKYTYYNHQGKKDVFIATSLMNKDECTIRFNGYITLSRGF
ncbi:Shiga toxin A subunit [Enterobacteriaceae bacterium 89]|nr:Shiga toxin A subunit [Enterobacteriaceae bacterium 89]